MKGPLVIVITINYNQSKMTLDCVASVLRSNYSNFKLIVIDNGSEKEDYSKLLEIGDLRVGVKRIDKNCGYVGGVNLGFDEAKSIKSDYILVMNNDTIIDSKAITNLVLVAEKHNQKAIISGKVFHFDKPNVIQVTGSLFTDKRFLKEIFPCKDKIDDGLCNKEEKRDMLDDIFWILPISILDQVGYYSKNFFLYAEQADFALRAVGKGYDLIYTPTAKIWHKGSISTGDGNRYAPSVNFWRKKSSIIYLYRNTKRIYFFSLFFKIFPKSLLKNFLNFLNLRKSNSTQSDYAELIGLWYGIKWVFNQKPDNGFNPFLKKL